MELPNFTKTWNELCEQYKKPNGKYRFWFFDSIYGKVYQAGYKAGFVDGSADMKQTALDILKNKHD
jgi:hypothetical protein